MKLKARTTQQVVKVMETYTYEDIEEREQHLAEMQLDDWQVLRTDRRKEKGYESIFEKEIVIK